MRAIVDIAHGGRAGAVGRDIRARKIPIPALCAASGRSSERSACATCRSQDCRRSGIRPISREGAGQAERLNLHNVLHVGMPVLDSLAGFATAITWQQMWGGVCSAASVRKIGVPPMGRATGFSMFIVPAFRIPWVRRTGRRCKAGVRGSFLSARLF